MTFAVANVFTAIEKHEGNTKMRAFLQGAAIGSIFAAVAFALPFLWGSTAPTTIIAPCAAQGAS